MTAEGDDELPAFVSLQAPGDLYQLLFAAKFDAAFWTGLSSAQALRYDFKAFKAGSKTLGMCRRAPQAVVVSGQLMQSDLVFTKRCCNA